MAKIQQAKVIKEAKEIFGKPLDREGLKKELSAYFTQDNYNALINRGEYKANAKNQFTDTDKGILNEVFFNLKSKGELQIIGLFPINAN